MKRNFNPLTLAEEELMDLLWSLDTPMTSVGILERTKEKSWGGTYVHKMLRSLQQKGYLKVVGTQQYGKQYARIFALAVSRQDFYAKFVVSKGIHRKDIGKIAVAIVKESEDVGNNDALISELEKLIDQLKEKDK